MSTYADPTKAALWVDGDAFRGTVNAAAPVDPFAAALTGFNAFGGINAGFTITPAQDIKDLDVWNNESGAPYRTAKKPATYSIKFRPVDLSKATALTLLRGGSVAETSPGNNIWKWTTGTDDEFSILLRVLDGVKRKVYYIPRCELAKLPDEVMNDADLEGWDFELKPLAPSGGVPAIQKFTNSGNPLA